MISSHTPASTVAPYQRCISDELIKGFAQCGGVVSINMCGYMLDLSNRDFVTADMIFRHIDHMVQLVSSDYVGLIPDYIPEPSLTIEGLKPHPEIYDDNGYAVTAGKKGFPCRARRMSLLLLSTGSWSMATPKKTAARSSARLCCGISNKSGDNLSQSLDGVEIFGVCFLYGDHQGNEQ